RSDRRQSMKTPDADDKSTLDAADKTASEGSGASSDSPAVQDIDEDDPSLPPEVRWYGRVGRVAMMASKVVGRSVAAAYNAVDPDVRRHIYQLPLAGVTALVPGDQDVV